MTCIACHSTEQTVFRAKEMMYGIDGEFDYLECKTCGSLQIAEIPADIAAYYPPYYYSFNIGYVELSLVNRLKQKIFYLLLAKRLRPVGRKIIERRPYLLAHFALRLGLDRGDRILDVGSGIGRLVDDLAKLGFPAPVGVDPYVAGDIALPSGARVEKREIDQIDERFDAILFNHSLEHVADPDAVLKAAAGKLRPGGKCIVRIPTASSLAFRQYRQNWVQLDAPRHLFIPSRQGMETLGKRAGLRLVKTDDDSTPFQFWGSEQYRRGHILYHDGGLDPRPGLFSAEQMANWEAQTEKVNREGAGDQTIFSFQAIAA